DLEDIAGLEGVALDGFAVDEGSAAAAVVNDDGLLALEEELAVGARDARVVDAVERLGAAAEHQVGPGLQGESLSLVRLGDDQQLQAHGFLRGNDRALSDRSYRTGKAPSSQ